MNPAKCTPDDYIHFLIAHPNRCTATEAQRVQPPKSPKAHDTFTRLLHRLEPDSDTLWQETAPLVRKAAGVLVLDDTTLDKPYAHKMDLVSYHWSGKHKDVVKGINLQTLLWTDGDTLIPVDYRIYDKAGDNKTKNDLFVELLTKAKERGFAPECVVFDSWYCSLDNLKLCRRLGYRWLTRLKSNRQVNPDNTRSRAVSECDISEEGTVVHLKGYGFIKVFRIVTRDSDTQYWATNDVEMEPMVRLQYAELSWGVEEYHRGLKQHCLVEKAQVRKGRAQRNHIGMSIRAFVRLEWHRFQTGVSWFEAKTGIIRHAVMSYLQNPLYKLELTA
jgi:putative transposase